MLGAHLPGPADVAGSDGENEFTASGCDFLFKCRSHFLTHYSWTQGVNHTGFSCKSLCFLCQWLYLFFSYLATKEHYCTLSSTCAKVWRSWVRNDTDRDFWIFCRLNFLRAINLSSSFLFADEIITRIPLIVCQNYQLTSFWCWWLFSGWFLPPLWKWWAQMSPTHFVIFIYLVVSASCWAGLDLHCQPRQ